VAAIQAEGIFQCIQTLARRFIAGVIQPAVRLQQNSRAKEAVACQRSEQCSPTNKFLQLSIT
jgi:hypothetical protein